MPPTSALAHRCLLAVALVAGCGDAPPALYGDPPAGQPQTTTPDNTSMDIMCPDDATLGVPVGMHPAYIERLALYATDRARTEPAKSNTTNWQAPYDMYDAVPPLLWDGNLSKAAIAHSTDMRDTPCFQHPSCDGTDPFVRIKMYYMGGSTLGENIAAGFGDGQDVVEQAWINEMGAPAGEHGHRDNTFSKDFNFVGFGFVDMGMKFPNYWTEDFAGASAPSPFPRIPVGSHFPQTGPMITFGALYYDQGGQKPDKVEVYLDGKPTPLSLIRGKEEMGGYEAQVAVPAGCHGYRLVATAGGKTVGCYPGKGQLGVGDSLACPEYLP